jgi:hypothetical protein
MTNKDHNKKPNRTPVAPKRQIDLTPVVPKHRSRSNLGDDALLQLMRDLIGPLMVRWLAERYDLTSVSKPKLNRFKTTKKVSDDGR